MKHRMTTLFVPAAAAALGLAAMTPLVDFDWNVAGTGDFFAPVNWTTGTVPGADDAAYIRNGGTAIADGKVPGNPTALALDTLEVGTEAGPGRFNANDVDIAVGPVGSFQPLRVGCASQTTTGTLAVDGHVTITDASSLRIDGNLDVGKLQAAGTAVVDGISSCTIERVADVVVGNRLEVAGHLLSDSVALVDGATITGHGDLVMRDIQSLTIEDECDLTDGEISLFSGSPGRGTAYYSATALFERIGSCSVGSDLDLGQVVADENETEIVDFDITFRDVNLLSLGADINWLVDGAYGTGAAAGVLDFDGTLTFERVFCTIARDIDMHSTVNMSGDGDVHAIGTWNLIDSTVIVDAGDTADIGAITFASGDPTGTLGGGAPGNSVEAYVNMTRSEFTAVDGIKLGRRLNGVPGILEADIDMVDGSYVSTAMLEVGTEGLFDLHIGGFTRVASSTVGAPGTYSAIDADDAILGGEFKATFDFIPPSGTHTFDLLVTASNTALDDTTATFSVNDMPPGFAVEFFGVVEEGGVDVVRLVVNGCAPVFSSETVRLGSPPNPSVFLPGVSNGPVVGQTWDPVISHAAFLPGATMDVAAIATGSANVPLSPYGTLLIDVFAFPPIQFATPPGLPFAIPIPSDCAFVGLALYSQGLSTDGATFSLTNALDITIGSI